jgi:uncharacterized protein YndB with AHSA1/START domain
MGDMRQNVLNDTAMVVRFPEQQAWDVVASTKIETDSRRVFYALSIAEYLETWLRVPDIEELKFSVDPLAHEKFRMDIYCAELLQASIQGSCLALNKDRIKYAWKKISAGSTVETVVDIQLSCGASGCMLSLRHRGFHDTLESDWHCEMWHRSLERLRGLMGKTEYGHVNLVH